MLITDSMLKKDSSGFLTVRAPITRAGVFPYRRVDGAIQMEAKLPEEVFREDTVLSARAKPVTDGHPPVPVMANNIAQYGRGMSHMDSVVEEERLKVTLTVTDEALIGRIESGVQTEISIGFLSDIVAENGNYQGDTYEFVQRNMEINHIAIVERGRAGSTVAIRADSDAWQIDEQDEGGNNMPTYKIDGKDHEVPSEVKSFLEAQAIKLDSAETKAKGLDALQGRYDALDAQIKQKDKELEEVKKQQLSADQLDTKVQERVQLVETVKPFLGDSFDFNGKSERELKEAVITSVKADFKADGLSDDYINGFFDLTTAQAQANGFSSTGANSMLTGDAAGSNAELEKMKADRLNLRN